MKNNEPASTSKQSTIIPDDFPITICPPSNRGRKAGLTVRPRKASNGVTWEAAQALAPDGKLTHDEQQKKRTTFLRRLTPKQAEEISVRKEIDSLNKENESLR